MVQCGRVLCGGQTLTGCVPEPLYPSHWIQVCGQPDIHDKGIRLSQLFSSLSCPDSNHGSSARIHRKDTGGTGCRCSAELSLCFALVRRTEARGCCGRVDSARYILPFRCMHALQNTMLALFPCTSLSREYYTEPLVHGRGQCS